MRNQDKYYCRTCQGLRNHKKLHEVSKRGSWEDDYIQWIEDFRIIECMGCETVSFLQVYGDSEMERVIDEYGNLEHYVNDTIYPSYLEQGRELENLHLLPTTIRDIYSETIAAFKSKSKILTAGGLRAIIEATCNHLKIKKGNLETRIDLLHSKGHLSLGEAKRLHSIRFLGNDALHEIEKPKEMQLYLLLEIVNHLLANLFINDKRIKGHLETVIDNYPDFLKLIQNKIKKELVGTEMSLNELLGKSKRLIVKKELVNFENTFFEEIKNGNHEFISEAPTKNKFKIEKMPDLGFFF